MARLVPPCAYQGGKGRLVAPIVEEIRAIIGQACLLDGGMVADIGCGSGAISLGLVSSGLHPSRILMVDAGPWALFWKAIGDGTFSLEEWNRLIDSAPKDPKEVYSWVVELSKLPATDRTVYVFLVLQAASFGSKAIWVSKDGNKWCNTTFRRYWEPTATSSRRSHVNSMMPMPETLRDRVILIAGEMRGVNAVCARAEAADYSGVYLAYIDPPYKGTTAYGHEMTVLEVCARLQTQGVQEVLVSEGYALSSRARLLSSGRSKGGISGERAKAANLEYLSRI